VNSSRIWQVVKNFQILGLYDVAMKMDDLDKVANGIRETFTLSWDPIAIACVLVNSYFALNMVISCWRTMREKIGGREFWMAMAVSNIALVILMSFGGFGEGLVYFLTSGGSYSLVTTTDGKVVQGSSVASAIFALIAAAKEQKEVDECVSRWEGRGDTDVEKARRAKRQLKGKQRLLMGPSLWLGLAAAVCFIIVLSSYSTEANVLPTYTQPASRLVNGSLLTQIGVNAGPGGTINDMSSIYYDIQHEAPLIYPGIVDAEMSVQASDWFTTEIAVLDNHQAQCQNGSMEMMNTPGCVFDTTSRTVTSCLAYISIGRAFMIENRLYSNPFSTIGWIVGTMLGAIGFTLIVISISLVYGTFKSLDQGSVMIISIFFTICIIKMFQLEWVVNNMLKSVSLSIYVPNLVVAGVFTGLLSMAMAYSVAWSDQAKGQFMSKFEGQVGKKEGERELSKRSNLQERVFNRWKEVADAALAINDNFLYNRAQEKMTMIGQGKCDLRMLLGLDKEATLVEEATGVSRQDLIQEIERLMRIPELESDYDKLSSLWGILSDETVSESTIKNVGAQIKSISNGFSSNT